MHTYTHIYTKGHRRSPIKSSEELQRQDTGVWVQILARISQASVLGFHPIGIPLGLADVSGSCQR